MKNIRVSEKAFFANCTRNHKDPKFYFKGEACVICTGLLESCPIRRVNSKGETVCLCFSEFTDEMEKEYLEAKIKEKPKSKQSPYTSMESAWGELLKRVERLESA